MDSTDMKRLRVGGPGSEVDHGQLAGGMDLLDQLDGSANRLCIREELQLVHRLDLTDRRVHRPRMTHSLYHVTRPSLALGA